METLNQYMTERSLPRSLQVSIRKHYRYFWSRRTVFEHEEEILSNLSTPLRADLLRFMYRDVIRRIPLFEVLLCRDPASPIRYTSCVDLMLTS